MTSALSLHSYLMQQQPQVDGDLVHLPNSNGLEPFRPLASALSPTRAAQQLPACHACASPSNNRAFSGASSAAQPADLQQAWPSPSQYWEQPPQLSFYPAHPSERRHSGDSAAGSLAPLQAPPQLPQSLAEHDILHHQLEQLLNDTHLWPLPPPSSTSSSTATMSLPSTPSISPPIWTGVQDPAAAAAVAARTVLAAAAAAAGAAAAAAAAHALPSSLVVTPQTDMLQAAGLVSFALSQPGAAYFVLATHPESAPTSPAVLNAALRIALCARKLVGGSGGTGGGAAAVHDLGLVPYLNGDSVDSLGLLVCRVPPATACASVPGGGRTLEIHAGSNAMLAGLSLQQALGAASSYTGGVAAVEVLFSADAASVALQALANLRLNLAGQGRDVVLLPHLMDWAPPPAGGGAGFGALYHISLISSDRLLPCFRWQCEGLPPAGVLGASGAHGGSGSSGHSHHQVGVRRSSEQLLGGRLGPASGTAPQASRNGYAGQQQQQQQLQQQHQPGSRSRGDTLQGAQQLYPAGAHSGASAGLLSGNGALFTRGAVAAGGLFSVGGLQPTQRSGGAALGGQARKADWVIVTDDTAIKNAAGAIAKVLSRIALQVPPAVCPVLLEKKTEQWTRVVSVAVKAITVARGYVANEGTGRDVGFQPYQRQSRGSSPMASSGQQQPPGALSDHGFRQPAEHSAGVYEDDGGRSDQQRVELGFDVFCLPQLPEAVEDPHNLPVKVTAHSRPGVVANVICKLVSERDSAVLITAGGQAMHVAITAVVAARSKLLARGTDIMLLPSFKTVDTTSTLGWESVFLQFRIIPFAAQALWGGSAGAEAPRGC